MLLALDIGNTNVTFGVFDNDQLVATWRIATDAKKMPDEYGLILSDLLSLKEINYSDITDIVICSVVPPLTPAFSEISKNYFRHSPLIVNPGIKTGIKNLYDSPRDVGADRIVNSVAAYEMFKSAVIIVDVGTFTVFDAVTSKAEYIGGSISLGISASAEAIYHTSSQLRRVELKRPPNAIGKNTIHSIQSGLILGYSDMVIGMVNRFRQELENETKVIATGGLAQVINKEVKIFDYVEPDLTLFGLKNIYNMNK
ncbi:MAG: pantothenate kinase [Chloroflexi bacterium]|nr:pantothenate kinase [Chloroflexota bacterium]|tara:strand:+ start:18268 stop:19032 length:765 start_codon:yes stop_codon:yes gene_type:complete